MSDSPSVLLPTETQALQKRVGVGQEAIPAIVEEWIRETSHSVAIVLARNSRLAEQWAADLDYFHRMPEGLAAGNRFAFLHFPEERLTEEDAAEGLDIGGERLAALMALRDMASGKSSARKLIIVTTPAALAQPVPSPRSLEANQIDLKYGQEFGFSQLVDALLELDYDSEDLCEAPGQFSRRGGLIDVYPITADRPYRIDFFGDEIESIKEFDPVTQRSGASADTIAIAASPRLQMEAAPRGILDHLPTAVAWGLIEPDELLDSISQADTEDAFAADELEENQEGGPPHQQVGAYWVDLRNQRSQAEDSWTTFSDLDLGGDEDLPTIAYEAESLAFYRTLPDETKLADERLADEQAARIRFLEQVHKWAQQGEQIILILPHASDQSRIQDMLAGTQSLKGWQPIFWQGDLNQGFRIRFRPKLDKLTWPSLKGAKGVVVVTETELFGRRRHRKPPTRQKALVSQSQVDQLLDFAELVEGEFVVHLQHGIAVYRGITKVDVRGQMREVLSLEFDEGVVLHVPLQESHLISRYVGLSKVRPKLGRVGSSRWAKTREAAERATLDLAAQLLEIQAKRDVAAGHAFGRDTQWQIEFESSFPFKETPDQMAAIRATKADMEKSVPMDRLICGDVGYGKTEVALRAAFKAVMDGKQVALLVPTTVLAQQHFLNFRDRMAGYPIVIELASRFRRPGEIKKILQATAEGKVDILIGTHRLIQRDVRFKDLGLVVIDEEQRFGVKHKEVFKEWRQSVDILTLSATPIPRTLYMALTGARELSVIETPPLERKPIQTIVKSYDDRLVTEVVRREIARGGQVFYLHNRVQTIDTVAARLRELMPDISFGVGHGQMDEKQLERVMTEFVDGRYNVLVCTTIIESGLDIPNCNTIIIEGADRFGLSQLYQLRGRVGRFKRQAYAYLLLHKHQRLVDVARKRLQAIRQHNQLGAGFRIAMRDLELRGAGNLLGAAQSGHIVGVGFELYCQLLRQSIARLKGEETAQLIRAAVKLDFVYQGEGQAEQADSSSRREGGFTVLQRIDRKEGACEPIPARLPASYLAETRLRIDMYRRLAMADAPAKVQEIRDAMIDRFGPYPDEVEALLRLTEIRCLAEQKGITTVESLGNRLKCRRKPGSPEEFVKLGTRFPRLKSNNALKRLNEIIVFLRNLPTKK